MHKQPWLVVLYMMVSCVAVAYVRSHPQQLDVIVAPHRASRSPLASNDLVKEGGGDAGGLWTALKSLMINADSLQLSNARLNK